MWAALLALTPQHSASADSGSWESPKARKTAFMGCIQTADIMFDTPDLMYAICTAMRCYGQDMLMTDVIMILLFNVLWKTSFSIIFYMSCASVQYFFWEYLLGKVGLVYAPFYFRCLD